MLYNKYHIKCQNRCQKNRQNRSQIEFRKECQNPWYKVCQNRCHKCFEWYVWNYARIVCQGWGLLEESFFPLLMVLVHAHRRLPVMNETRGSFDHSSPQWPSFCGPYTITSSRGRSWRDRGSLEKLHWGFESGRWGSKGRTCWGTKGQLQLETIRQATKAVLAGVANSLRNCFPAGWSMKKCVPPNLLTPASTGCDRVSLADLEKATFDRPKTMHFFFNYDFRSFQATPQFYQHEDFHRLIFSADEGTEVGGKQKQGTMSLLYGIHLKKIVSGSKKIIRSQKKNYRDQKTYSWSGKERRKEKGRKEERKAGREEGRQDGRKDGRKEWNLLKVAIQLYQCDLIYILYAHIRNVVYYIYLEYHIILFIYV